MQFSFSAAAGAQLQPGCTMAAWKQGSRRWKGALHCLERIKPSQESLARGQDQCQQTDNVVLFCRPWQRRWRVVTLLHQKKPASSVMALASAKPLHGYLTGEMGCFLGHSHFLDTPCFPERAESSLGWQWPTGSGLTVSWSARTELMGAKIIFYLCRASSHQKLSTC